MGAKKIQLFGLKENDQLVFSSLLSLLSFKTSDNWSITENELGDIQIVDIDTSEGKKAASDFEQKGHSVIRLSTAMQSQQDEMWLHKPLRAADILKCLNKINAGNSTPVVASNDSANIKVVKLKRWPPKEILKNTPNSSRLCASLMHHAISVEKAANMVGITVEQVRKFVNECDKYQCIEYRSISLEHQVVNAESSAKNATLFNKLRMKFGAKG